MAQSWKGWCWNLGLASCLAISGAISSSNANCAFAQSVIIPDRTLGSESSRVVPNYGGDPVELLTGGATRGTNLFHSFLELNVSEGRGAFFLSPSTNIQNIVARVTGRNRSEIRGTLGIIDGNFAASNANLFLINPNGIIFGPNATLGVGGSFVASTARGIKFADGTQFSATAPQDTPLLTVSVPIGLQFGGSAGDILVQGFGRSAPQGFGLAVQPGKTLALVGGNVNLDGGILQASGGQIALGGILGAGTIGLNLDSNNLPLSFPNDVARADVSLSNGAVVDVSGEGGGGIQVQGRHVTLTDRSLLFASTRGSQNGRGISIGAEQLTIQDGSQVTASTQGAGSGGTLAVSASDSVQVIGSDADGNPSFLSTETFGEGAAGNLTIETRQLIVQNGANVSASTRGQGQGGTLKVNASDFVKLSGTSSAPSQLPSGLFTQTLGTGNAGSLTINTRQLIVQDGAEVTVGTGTVSQGKGGTLSVTASDSVELSETAPNPLNTSGLFARSRGTGDAGSLTIATGQLIVRDGAQVTVSSLGSGNAGKLEVAAGSIRLDNLGAIIAETASTQGGDITLQAQDSLLLRNNSRISTTAGTEGAGGNGGNITIKTPFIIAVPSENSDISANAFRGNGGKVAITAQTIFGSQFREQPTPESDITASSTGGGINGVVNISTLSINPSLRLIALPAGVVNVSGLIAQGCGAGSGTTASQFIVTGRGGLPPNPGVALSSDAVWEDARLTAATVNQHRSENVTATQPSPPAAVAIVPAQGWVFNNKGEVTLTAQAPNVTPYRFGYTPVTCHVR